MSQQIALSHIQIRNLQVFEIAFKKYKKELKAEELPTLEIVENPSHTLAKLTRENRVVATLRFQPDDGKVDQTPAISKTGQITNGYGRLSGDEDFLKENAAFKNPIQHDRFDAYYSAQAIQSILQEEGFESQEFEVDENCEASFYATQEVEEMEAVQAF